MKDLPFVFLAVLALGGISGCISPDDSQVQGGIPLGMEIFYDQSANDDSDELQTNVFEPGSPLIGHRLAFKLEATENGDYEWAGGESCTPGQYNSEEPWVPADCSGLEGQLEYQVPAPSDRQEASYPIHGNEMSLNLPGSMYLRFFVPSIDYAPTEEMEAYRIADPCGDDLEVLRHRITGVEGRVDLLEPVEILVEGSANIDVVFWIECRAATWD